MVFGPSVARAGFVGLCLMPLGWLLFASHIGALAKRPLAGTDLYVSPSGNDSNNGSAAKPWRTLIYAAKVADPGATVHVAPGSYSGSVVSSVSGTAQARIRFLSEVRYAAQVVGDTGSEAAWTNRGDYVDIMGFDVSGAVANGIENLGSFTAITGNRVHEMAVPCNQNGGSGINNANYQAHDNDIIANLVYGVNPSSGCQSRRGVGIYHSNTRGHIQNNIVFSNGSVGIQLWHAANAVVVANNTVFNNKGNGIVIGAGDGPAGAINDNSIVINNISVNNGYYGIQEFGATGNNNVFSNNLVDQNPAGNVQILKASISGTITRNPGFVRYTGDSSGDYHLSANSPAVDAGISQEAPSRDFDGASRPAGKGYDVGAYEAGATPAPWPWP